MLDAAKNRIKSKPTEEICKNADVEITGSAFCFKSLGQKIQIDLNNFDISPAPDPWHTLIVLHYLSFADGTQLSGEQMNFSEYKDGVIRGTRFDRQVDAETRDNASEFTKEELIQRCLLMGAEIIPSNADIYAKFYFLPRYPIWLKIWMEDEEFPASGKMLTDKRADHYLPLEDAITAGDIILNEIFKNTKI